MYNGIKISMVEPWKDKDLMKNLYTECETQKEMAEELNTSEYTISVWVRKHGLKKYQSKNGVYFRNANKDNHYRINIRNEIVLAEHTVVALVQNDPHKVFSDDYEVHHKNKCSLDNRNENLEVVTKETHEKIHKNEDWAKKVGYLTNK